METIVYRSLDEAETAWRDFEATAECWPFQSFDFVSAWHRTIGRAKGVEPCIALVVDSNDTPVMLLPLGLEKRGPFRRLSWLGGRMADFKGPLLARDLGEGVTGGQFEKTWDAIRKALPAHDFVVFDAQPDVIGTQRNPFATLSKRLHPSASHYTLLEGDFDSFLASKRSGKSRWRMRRKYRLLEELGEVEFVVPTTDAEIESIMWAVFEQKSRVYRELGVRNLFAEPECREFCLSLAKSSSPGGLAHLSALKLDGEIIAAHWGLVFRRRFYFLFPSYAEGDIQRLSPGVSLLQHLFQWCFEHGVQAFDFTAGDEQYKERWCDRELELYCHFQATSLPGLAPAGVSSAATAVKGVIKRSEVLWPVAERVRSALGRGRSLIRSRRRDTP
ncbi:MAG: GNAT family N-acetyltransferase [Gemmatimonadota bacterium]|jgi:CelD/BcsL family acetyltransferase involved in cellulose biosynthesis